MTAPNPSHEFTIPEAIGKRVDPTYSQTLHTQVKQLLNIHHNGFPGTRPVLFEAKHLDTLEREDYFVCDRNFTARCLLFFTKTPKGYASFMLNGHHTWFYIPQLLFPSRSRDNEFLTDTLMDGELILENEIEKTWRFLIYDLMVLNGTSIVQRSFSTRLGMLRQEVLHPWKACYQADPTHPPPIPIELKRMERSYGSHIVFDQIHKSQSRKDSIIWTPVKCPYVPGVCDKLLKWKPPEMIVLNFRINAKWSNEHKPIYSLDVLSNVTYKFYDHFQPEPELAIRWKENLPDGRIAECRYDPSWQVTIVEQGYAPVVRTGGWRFVRFCDEKTATVDSEQDAKEAMHMVKQGVPKDQLLTHMDRIRKAWKAREKGIFPPSKPSLPGSTNDHSTSPVLPSPSLDTASRQNSIDFMFKSRQNSVDESWKPRQGSITEVPDPVAKDSHLKRLRSPTPEVDIPKLDSSNTITSSNSSEPTEPAMASPTLAAHDLPLHLATQSNQLSPRTERKHANKRSKINEQDQMTHDRTLPMDHRQPTPPPPPSPPHAPPPQHQPRNSSIHNLLTSPQDPHVKPEDHQERQPTPTDPHQQQRPILATDSHYPIKRMSPSSSPHSRSSTSSTSSLYKRHSSSTPTQPTASTYPPPSSSSRLYQLSSLLQAQSLTASPPPPPHANAPVQPQQPTFLNFPVETNTRSYSQAELGPLSPSQSTPPPRRSFQPFTPPVPQHQPLPYAPYAPTHPSHPPQKHPSHPHYQPYFPQPPAASMPPAMSPSVSSHPSAPSSNKSSAKTKINFILN
ncbi:hypothetical protein DM01DRAFT_1403226 [Hesseltinella vesiculosa]|uniref:mRNA capping enzyme adenylation domain-containing protein n=1 Tax=Hesseltinella vesiculosa TaxID=101127 RepID=A0A1X2GXG2_9FUNG|nr:hypothetical protein DM01DRAFT_1403226 [Hesseltinella vesiculosa]